MEPIFLLLILGKCLNETAFPYNKEMSIMKAGSKWGEAIVLHENGKIKHIEECRYGIILNYKDFNIGNCETSSGYEPK